MRLFLVAASASEFIHRFTALAQRCGLRQVRAPAHGYGEYQRAAQLWGLQALPAADAAPVPQQSLLQWACEPASPLGGHDAALAAWRCPSAQAAVAEASRGLGEAMVGINVGDLPAPHRLAERGW